MHNATNEKDQLRSDYQKLIQELLWANPWLDKPENTQRLLQESRKLIEQLLNERSDGDVG